MFNLCNEPWIKVRYLTGEIKEVGIRKALEDAEWIADIISPTFHKDTVYIYDVLVYRLLATIVMAAWYKEENGYAMKNASRVPLEEGIYSDVVKTYLDKFEDRFDLFSSDHPFLQNPALGSLPKREDDSYKAYNILVPAANAPVFGKYRGIDTSKKKVWEQYDISDKEFAYMVLYYAVLGRTPCAATYKENSLSSTAAVFVVPKGANLGDTIRLNVFSLKESGRPSNGQDIPDMPVWEWNSVYDVEKYPASELIHNELACAFYPGISILGVKTSNNGFIQGILRANGKEKPLMGLSPNDTGKLESIHKDRQAIEVWKREKDKTTKEERNVFACYMGFKPDTNTASMMCIRATERICGAFNCPIVENIVDIADLKSHIDIYYRILDDKKTNVLGLGRIDGGRSLTWLSLKNEEKRAVAVEYQKMYEQTRSDLRSALKMLFDKEEPIVEEGVRKLAEFFEEDFFGQFTLELGVSTGLKDPALRLMKETLRIFDRCMGKTNNIFEYVPVRDELYRKLNNRREKV